MGFYLMQVIEMEEVLSSMVLNSDHTVIKYVLVSSRTMERESTKRVAKENERKKLLSLDLQWQEIFFLHC